VTIVPWREECYQFLYLSTVNIAILDDININTKETETKQVQRPGDAGQQDVKIEDKNYASYNWSFRSNWKGIRSEP